MTSLVLRKETRVAGERERERVNLHPTLGCCEVCDHLHDLNLSIVLISLDVAAIVNKKVKKLTRRSRSVYNKIVFP